MELIYKHKAYRTVLIPYDYKFDRVTEIREKMLREVGITVPYFAKSIRGAGILDKERVESAVKFLSDNGMPPLLRCGGYKPEEDEIHAEILPPYKGTHRIYGETLVTIMTIEITGSEWSISDIISSWATIFTPWWNS